MVLLGGKSKGKKLPVRLYPVFYFKRKDLSTDLKIFMFARTILNYVMFINSTYACKPKKISYQKDSFYNELK